MARRVALGVLDKVQRQGCFTQYALDGELKRLRVSQIQFSPLITTLVYGTLQWRGQSDWLLSHYVHKGLKKINPVILQILRMGVFQIVHLSTPDYAVVHESVELARQLRGEKVSGFVNAILRRVVRAKEEGFPLPSPEKDPVNSLVARASLPEWLASRWFSEMGYEQALQLGLKLNERPPFTIRVNTLRTSSSDLQAELEAEGAHIERGRWLPEAMNVSRLTAPVQRDSFRRGDWTVQDEASMLVSRIVNPRPGEVVVDACCGPGGKSGHLAQLMGDQGRVIAIDSLQGKVSMAKAAMKRLGYTSVETLVADLSSHHDLPPIQADKVLLDAPCSNLGTLRRHPEAKWKRSHQDIAEAARLQIKLLQNTSRLVKEGGVLVYSVCSVNREEGEDVVERFLERDGKGDERHFSVDATLEGLPEKCSEIVTGEGFFRTWPHRHDTDGFIAVRLRRIR